MAINYRKLIEKTRFDLGYLLHDLIFRQSLVERGKVEIAGGVPVVSLYGVKVCVLEIGRNHQMKGGTITIRYQEVE